MTRSVIRRLLLVNMMVSAIAMAAWHVTRLATESPAPTIKILWKETVADTERLALERDFQMRNPERIAPRAYNYDLLDSRSPVIQAIVEHPAVQATGDLDPRRFTVATTTEPGDTKRWVWHRWARDASARMVSVGLTIWLAVSVVLGLIARVGSLSSSQRMRQSG